MGEDRNWDLEDGMKGRGECRDAGRRNTEGREIREVFFGGGVDAGSQIGSDIGSDAGLGIGSDIGGSDASGDDDGIAVASDDAGDGSDSVRRIGTTAGAGTDVSGIPDSETSITDALRCLTDDEYRNDFHRYEELLMRREDLRKSIVQLRIRHVSLFGRLEHELYEAKVACIRLKKAIAFCQKSLNQGRIGVAESELKGHLDKVMAEYDSTLKQMAEENETVKSMSPVREDEVLKCRSCYRKVVLLLHPDICPTTMEREEIRELWERASAAYRLNDTEELEDILILAQQALRDDGLEVGGDGKPQETPRIPCLAERIIDLEKEIQSIMDSEAFQEGQVMDDPDAVAEKKSMLSSEADSFRLYARQLEAVLEAMKARLLMVDDLSDSSDEGKSIDGGDAGESADGESADDVESAGDGGSYDVDNFHGDDPDGADNGDGRSGEIPCGLWGRKEDVVE